VRHDDQLQCYFPDAKTIRIDRRVTARSSRRSWTARSRRSRRTTGWRWATSSGSSAGLQWIHLDPKDALRYAQRLCAELGSGLLLRAKTLGAKQQVLEQYGFTDLRVARRPAQRGEEHLLLQSKDWKRDVQPPDEPKPGATGWTIGAPPPGFRLVKEMQRTLPNRRCPSPSSS